MESTSNENNSASVFNDLDRFELPETPDEMELAPGQRVVAVGDIHGNYCLLVRCLQAADLIAWTKKETESSIGDDVEEWNWIGGNTILVQVGDLVDRGDEEVKVFLLLARLGREALKSGGAVVVLWGNHEVDNACGLFTYARFYDTPWVDALGSILAKEHGPNWQEQVRILSKSKSDWNQTRDPARWPAFRPGGMLAKPFLSKLKIMAKVGKTVFVHAGFHARHIAQYGGIATMNEVARNWILHDVLSGLEKGEEDDENVTAILE